VSSQVYGHRALFRDSTIYWTIVIV